MKDNFSYEDCKNLTVETIYNYEIHRKAVTDYNTFLSEENGNSSINSLVRFLLEPLEINNLLFGLDSLMMNEKILCLNFLLIGDDGNEFASSLFIHFNGLYSVEDMCLKYGKHEEYIIYDGEIINNNFAILEVIALIEGHLWHSSAQGTDKHFFTPINLDGPDSIQFNDVDGSVVSESELYELDRGNEFLRFKNSRPPITRLPRSFYLPKGKRASVTTIPHRRDK